MPDMTLCSNKDCTLRDRCYRGTAEPDLAYQSYANFKDPLEQTCNYFIPNEVVDPEG